MRKLRAMLALVMALVMLGGTVLADIQIPTWDDTGELITYYTPKLTSNASGYTINAQVRVDATDCTPGLCIAFEYHAFYSLVDGTNTGEFLIDYQNGTSSVVSNVRIPLPPSADPSQPIDIHVRVYNNSRYISEHEMRVDGTSICTHKASKKLVWDGLEYVQYRLSDPDYNEKHAIFHKLMDRHRGTCSKCGNVFFDYDNLRDEAHHLPACPCGYTQPGYNAIHSVQLMPVNECQAGAEFQLVVVTDKNVSTVYCKNNLGVELNYNSIKTSKSETADGKIRVSIIYPSSENVIGRRTWTVTAHDAHGKKIGEKESNALIIRSEAAIERTTRCQLAMKNFANLTTQTARGAESYKELTNSDFGGLRVWQMVARQSFDKSSDLGFTVLNSVTSAWSDIPGAIFNIISHDMVYDEEKLNKMTNEMWEMLILDTLNNELAKKNSSVSPSNTVSQTAQIWDTVDTLITETQDITVFDETKGITKAIAELARKNFYDGWGEYVKRFPNSSISQYADLMDTKVWSLANAVTFSKYLPDIMSSFSIVSTGIETQAKVDELKSKYSKLMENIEDSVAQLTVLIEDARRMGNPQLEKVATQMLQELTHQQLNFIVAFLANYGDASGEVGLAAMETALDKALGTVSGGLLNIADLLTDGFKAVTNFDEVYDAGARLYMYYAMATSFDFVNTDVYYNECKYTYETYGLMARVHIAGCDAAKDYLDALDKEWYEMGEDKKNFGFESHEELQKAKRMLDKEKQLFFNYANTVSVQP